MNVIQRLMRLAIMSRGGYAIIPLGKNGITFYINEDKFSAFVGDGGDISVFSIGAFGASNKDCMIVSPKSVKLEEWFSDGVQ